MNHFPPIDENLTSIRLGQAEKAFSYFRPTGSDQTRYPENLTTPKFKADTVKLAFSSEILHFQSDFTWVPTFCAGSQIRFAELAPRHVTDHLVFIRPTRIEFSDVGAVTEHRNAIPVFEYFIQTMRDIKNGSASFSKTCDELEETFGFAIG